MFGYGPGEVVGQPTRALYDDGADYASIGSAAGRREAFTRERLPFRRKDGSLLWTTSRSVPIGHDEFLGHIHEAGLKLLDAASEGAAHWDFHHEVVDVMALVRDTAQLFAGEARDKGVRIVVDGTLDGPPFRADPLRFRQALAAYLDNALTHSPRGARIDVSALQRGPNLRVTVQDLGVGMDSTRGSVFEFRLPSQ